MPFVKGHKKTGGRKKGSVSLFSIQRDVAAKLSELGFDPIIRLVEVAEKQDCKPDTLVRICGELAKYLHPQRKAVELSGPGGAPVEISDVSGYELLLGRINSLATRKSKGTDSQRAD